MRLVIFDIDGTLTQTMKADADCFVRSLAEVCGFRDVDTDWSGYKHATDSGMFHEIHEARTGRPPSALVISRFRPHFVSVCLSECRPRPLLPQSEGPRCRFLAWRTAQSIGWRLLPGRGVTRHASRWPVPGCVLTTIRQHRRMTRSTGSPL